MTATAWWPGAYDYRAVYLRVINALAAKAGSTRRLIAGDCPGMHNG